MARNEAVDACLSSQVDAVATSPANKEAMKSAGISNQNWRFSPSVPKPRSSAWLSFAKPLVVAW